MIKTRNRCAVLIIAFAVIPSSISAQTAGSKIQASQNAPTADGRHDFDFEIGTWKAHVRKRVHPLTDSEVWEDYDGTVVTRSLPMLAGWNESEMRVDSSTTHKHIALLAVRLYNPTSRQWSIYGSSINTGTFDPPQVGQFSNTRGEFYAQDSYNGRAVYIRFVWQNVSPHVTHFEQAFSVDGGQTWETNWIYDGTRVGE